jgi:hypothetical protein
LVEVENSEVGADGGGRLGEGEGELVDVRDESRDGGAEAGWEAVAGFHEDAPSAEEAGVEVEDGQLGVWRAVQDGLLQRPDNLLVAFVITNGHVAESVENSFSFVAAVPHAEKCAEEGEEYRWERLRGISIRYTQVYDAD